MVCKVNSIVMEASSKEEKNNKKEMSASEFINLQETEQIDPNKLFADNNTKSDDDVVVLAKEKNDNIQLFDIYDDT